MSCHSVAVRVLSSRRSQARRIHAARLRPSRSAALRQRSNCSLLSNDSTNRGALCRSLVVFILVYMVASERRPEKRPHSGRTSQRHMRPMVTHTACTENEGQKSVYQLPTLRKTRRTDLLLCLAYPEGYHRAIRTSSKKERPGF